MREPGMTISNIQRFVTAENAVLVEGDAPIAGKISLDVRPRSDAVAQIDQPGNPALERLHAVGKGVAQPLHDLEQRQIDIGRSAAGGISAAIALYKSFEIAEIFR